MVVHAHRILMVAEGAPVPDGGRLSVIMELAAPVNYARVAKLVTRVGGLAPFTSSELNQIADIGDQAQRWGPARIAFYQEVQKRTQADADLRTAKRIAKILSKVRSDLVVRLSKANNYPTARMYIDALRSFDELAPVQMEQVIASMMENKRLSGMRLEPRQFLFFRDLLAAHASWISAIRVAQLIGILQVAVEKDPSLAQL